MRIEIVMPQMGESVTEGTVTQWLKNIGDYVERDEPLVEITTDKVDAEVPSIVAGILVAQLVEVGQTVEINTIIAIIDTAAKPGEVSIETSTASAEAEKPAVVTRAGGALASYSSGSDVAVAERPVSAASSIASLAEVGSVEDLRRTKSTPVVRRIAAEHEISDLSTVPGTGMSGRVTKQDILAFIADGKHSQPAVVERPSAPKQREIHVPAIAVGERDRVERLSPNRLAIAEHMTRSLSTSAHAHTVHEIDFSNVTRARKAMKDDFASRGVNLTFTAFMVKAIGDALAEFPIVNASMDGDQVIYRGDINVGVAVALEESLIVPVIRNVDELSLLGIARSIGDLAERARTKRLKADEVRGGTFTLTNHGVFGAEFGVPVINQPQAAIVSTGAIKKRVLVDQKTDAIIIRPTAIWCMSFDHRLIDGATADKFMARMRDILENWPS